MRKVKKTKEEQISDLFQITKTIKGIYDKLIVTRIGHSKEEYQRNIEDLNLCLELENHIYQQLLPTVKNTFQDYEEIQNIIHRHPKYQNDPLLLERIENYLACYHFLNPYLSNYSNQNTQEEANIIAIANQHNMNFIEMKTYLFDKLIMTTQDIDQITFYTKQKFETIFQYKAIECLLLNKKSMEEPILSGKEKCLLFGQNPILVDEIYFQKSSFAVKNMISILMRNPYHLEQKPIFLNIISAISLLNKSQLETLYGEIFKNYLYIYHKEIPPVLEEVVNIFQQAREKIQVKKKERSR